ncbi:WD40 repeat containing protein [Trachipleistophora hominis]|uniref:WD40 repeat containing protein n=1 Tax=Trachipleistophora hominis TaxID=72359 RepID=L7JZH6_TRAHO|nr:WD40 repeat containing protein [Trachipleistophora hominis]
MYFAMRTIKKSSSAVCAANVFYQQRECLAVSTGKYLNFYDIMDGKFHKIGELQLGSFVVAVIPIENKKFVLISLDNQYVVVNDQKVVKRGRVSKERFWRVENKIQKCVYANGKIVILFNNNKLSIMHVASNSVKIDDNLKDLLAYNVYDILVHKNEIIALLGDIEGKTYIHHYVFKENKRGIVFKDRRIMSNAYRILMANDRLYVFRDGVVTVIDGDSHVDMQFANPSMINGIEYKNGLLLTMEDRELVYISDKVNILHRFSDTIDNIVPTSGLLFGLSFYGHSILFTIDNAVTITDALENVSQPTNLHFRKNLHFLSGMNFNNSMCEMSYKIPVKYEEYINFPKIVKRTWKYNEYLIVSFLNEGLIMKNKTAWEKVGEVQNLRVLADCCVFNTKTHIYRLTTFLTAKESKSIVLSDIDDERVVVYTDTKEIDVYDVNTLVIRCSTAFDAEISLIKWVSEMVLISTFDNQMYVLDKELAKIKTFDFECLRAAERVSSAYMIVCTLTSKIYVMDLATQQARLLFKMEHVTQLERYGDGVFAIGKNVIYVSKQLVCYDTELSELSSMHCGNILLFTRENSIFSVNLGAEPVFKIRRRAINGEGLFLSKSRNDYYLGYRQECSSILVHVRKGKEHVMKIPNEVIRSAKRINKYLVVATNYKDAHDNNYSRLVLLKKMTKIYEVCKPGALFSIDVSKDYVATSHGVFLTVYSVLNQVLVELAQIPCPIFPWKIRFNAYNLMICDVFRSFSVYQFDPETNTIIETSRCFEKFVADEGVPIENEYLVSDAIGNLFNCVSDDMDNEIIKRGSFNYQEGVICIERGSLNVKKDRDTYYFSTSSGSIGVIKKYEDNRILDQIKNVIEVIGANLVFNYNDATAYETEDGTKGSTCFIDCDVLGGYKEYKDVILRFCSNYEEVEPWIEELINIH